MAAGPPYTAYHPRWLRQQVSTYWWLQRRTHVVFILRELSSLFVAWAVVFLLLFVRAVAAGEAAYAQFLAFAARLPALALNLAALVFILFHAITWFNLAPAAMVVHVRGRRLPGVLIAAANYLAAIVASAFIAWLLLVA
jgi:fumarate reductase subunit C